MRNLLERLLGRFGLSIAAANSSPSPGGGGAPALGDAQHRQCGRGGGTVSRLAPIERGDCPPPPPLISFASPLPPPGEGGTSVAAAARHSHDALPQAKTARDDAAQHF